MAPLLEQAMSSYCDSVGAWQRFVRSVLTGPYGDGPDQVQRALLEHGEAAFKKGDLARAAKCLGSGLSFPWYGNAEGRKRSLGQFCEAWLETQPTQARVDVALLLIEGCGMGVPITVLRRHLVMDALRECLVVEPAGTWLITATAELSGIRETELR